MPKNLSPLLLALILTLPTPALAVSRFTSIGETFRRLPILGLDSDKDGAEAVTVEMYDLPAPLPPQDAPVPTFDPVTHVDPIDTFIWAHTVDITTVKEADIHQYGMEVRRILAMRKLDAVGYYNARGTVADLSGLTERGRGLLKHLVRPEVQAMLATIRYAEGTIGERGYHTGFNYNPIRDLSWHPMKVWGGSSAAGAYQAMNYSFPPAAAAIGLKDFTPLSQDLFALYQMQHKHGIDLATFSDADFQSIIHDKLSKEWASFPDASGLSRYTFKGRRQPAKPMSKLWETYTNAKAGQLPNMGYDWYWFNPLTAAALREFQHAYQVEPTGNFDSATWKAVFDGTFGSWLPPKPEPVVVAPRPKFRNVSVHNADHAAQPGETIGGYRVTSPFGRRKSPCAGCSEFHPAWDLATPIGTPVYAPFDGIEVSTFYTASSGHVLRFTHDGIQYSLLHMDKVMPGGYEKGWIMGYTGDTGNGTGPHLDVRSKQNGMWVLPSREVVHFMLDPTAFTDLNPDPAPETGVVDPEPALPNEIEDDANVGVPAIVTPATPRGFWGWMAWGLANPAPRR